MIFDKHKKRLVVVFVTLFSLCLGCGSGSGVDRNTLGGKVTFAGKPVPYGLIYFKPDTSKGNSGPQGFAEIVDGQYSTKDVGMGTVTGPLVVQISGFPEGRDDNGEIRSKPLFPQYQTRIELAGGTTAMDFDIPGR